MSYRVKNWEKFQHFKDRRPPWIKLYREILDQRDISLISDCAYRVLVGCWLLASEDDTQQGLLPSVEDIAFRLRIDKSKIIKVLPELAPWLYQDDINPISGRYQDDAPETETETETDKEKAIAFSSAVSDKSLPAAETKKTAISFDFKLGQWDGIEVEDAAAWESAYPAIHVETELFRAAEWVKANPANRKSNWRRFLTNWFSRAQERAPRRAA